MGHPCLTPRPITPGSESPPTVRTTASCLMDRSCNNLLSLQSMCKLFSISNILTQFTLSNAFSKSTKQIYTSFPHSKLLSHSVLITPLLITRFCASQESLFQQLSGKAIEPQPVPIRPH